MPTKLFEQKIDANGIPAAKAALDQQVTEFFNSSPAGTTKLHSTGDTVFDEKLLMRVVTYRDPGEPEDSVSA